MVPPDHGRRFSRRALLTEEHGGVLVIVALTLVVLIALSAVVVDLAFMRWDKRASQTSADMASVAGAMSLPFDGEGSGLEACETAWAYVVENSLVPDADPNPCQAALTAGEFEASCDPADPEQNIVEHTDDPYVVRIIWPVVDDEFLADRTDASDGEDPCERIAVQIQRERGFFLAGIFDVIGGGSGISSGFTTAPAVARASHGEDISAVASLVVLDPHGCRVLRTFGQQRNAIMVREGEGDQKTGIIVVDSDGADCGLGAQERIIRVGGTNTQVKAGVYEIATVSPNEQHRGFVGDGLIRSFALQAGIVDRNKVYDEDKVPTADDEAWRGNVAGGHPSPRHPQAGRRFTRSPVEYRYDCRDDYVFTEETHVAIDDCPGQKDANDDWIVEPNEDAHISNLREAVDGGPDGDEWPAGYWTVLSETEDCRIDDERELAPGNYWFDCDLDVRPQGDLTIPDGNVVVEDGIDVSGNLTINSSSNDSWVVVRNDDLRKSSGGDVILGNASGGVFVLLEDGRFITRGGSGEAFSWIAPHEGTFEDLALWSESTDIHDMGGGVDNFEVEGVFYMPNALFDFSGSGRMSQDNAQFIAYRVQAGGGGQLTMTPDPDRSVQEPFFKVNLIR